MYKLSRRHFLCMPPALVLPEALDQLAALPLTPSQTEGPFYPDRLPTDQDNDLVRTGDFGQTAEGQIAYLGGGIYDQEGFPLAGAKIEIWQCDARGVYLHSADPRHKTRDSGFQGYGFWVTRDDGLFQFKTIRPVAYPGRVPHIHVKITAANGASLTTQFYAEGDPGLEDDIYEPDALMAHYDVIMGLTPPDQS